MHDLSLFCRCNKHGCCLVGKKPGRGKYSRSAHIHTQRDSSRKSVAVSSSALCQYESFFPACSHFCPLNLTHAYDDDSIAYNDTPLVRLLTHSFVRPFHCLLARSLVRLFALLSASFALSIRYSIERNDFEAIHLRTNDIFWPKAEIARFCLFVCCLFVSVAFCIRLFLYLPAHTRTRTHTYAYHTQMQIQIAAVCIY